MRNLIIALTLVLSAVGASGAQEDLSSRKPLALRSVRPDKTTAAVYERVTLDLDLDAAYANPFDSAEIRVDAEVRPPSGKPWTAPGFLFRDYARRREGGEEELDPAGPPRWQVRLALVEPGPHQVVVSATDKTGTVRSTPVTLTATKADVPGYARRSPADVRYFVTDRGETFFPIGANVCWAGSRGQTYDYDLWLPKYAAARCNYWRMWLSPEWFTFSLNTAESGYDRIDLARAWRVDYVTGVSEQLGLRVLFCIDSFNILRSKRNQHGLWEDAPYIKARGGPCEKPGDYFTNPASLKAYRDRLRYIVARWGGSPSVFAWEFWNEVDIIDDYSSETVTAWHCDMARYLRGLDPWRHLITTSTATPRGDPRLDALPELDFVQTHHYTGGDQVAQFDRDRLDKAAARDRPHYLGEFGLGHDGRQTARDDPAGIHLHNALYAGVGQEHGGTPMTWWWDSYVEPRNLYPIFGSFARWIEGFDFVRQAPKRVVAEVLFADPAAGAVPERAPLVPQDGSWDPAPYNAPVAVTVDRFGKVASDRPLARVMHGVGGHKDLHNPATFTLDVPRATTFGVIVEGVSGWGGARLVITLDGKTALDQDFPDTDKAGTATMSQYNKAYRIDLPAGKHTVKVENTGQDWFNVAYEILWRVQGPPLRVWGLAGKTRALVWVENRHYLWNRPADAKADPPPIERAKLVLTLTPGEWTVERWDTQAGKVVATERKTARADGRLEIDLPPIVWDAAYRLSR